jgi:hypothetical protein
MLPDVDLIVQAKLLDILIANNIHFDTHINFILKTFIQRSYLLRKFRDYRPKAYLLSNSVGFLKHL